MVVIMGEDGPVTGSTPTDATPVPFWLVLPTGTLLMPPCPPPPLLPPGAVVPEPPPPGVVVP